VRRLSLEKYHGLGNDFLILLDREGETPIDEELTRRLCNRHRGVGADGLIRVTPGSDGVDVTMELRNADGGRAEISGNGIRCVARAVIDGGMTAGPDLLVRSDAGVHRLRIRDDGLVSADMGPAKVGPEQRQSTPRWRLRAVEIGNPHLVLLCPDPTAVHVSEFGPKLEGLRPGGVNVEFVAPGPRRDELTVRFWERGAGETEASGTGSCAAAAAAHEWDLVGPHVVVHNPGGDLEVELGETVTLIGPAEHVCTVELAQ
jgi:diaminopimelate epimerase